MNSYAKLFLGFVSRRYSRDTTIQPLFFALLISTKYECLLYVP